MTRIMLTFLTLAVLGGVASADRGRGHRWKHHNKSHRNGSTWSGGVVVHTQPAPVYQPRRVYVDRSRVVRRPIYVQRPVVRYRYYNYQQRPQVLAENYQAMTGYYWVAGQWTWNGYEWTWTAGHYEPDPNYTDYSYDDGYNSHAHSPDCGHYDGY